MATKDGERLHAGTLREVADRLWRRFALTGSVTEATLLSEVATEISRLATEAAAQPPHLSDWVRACEGTGLGEPTWLPCDDDLERFIADFAIGVQVELRLDADNSGVQPTVFGEYAGYTCLTPAELCSALERLAQEAK